MENNLDNVALDLYGKIQTRFPNIKIGDEGATVLTKKSDIPKARFFEFEYADHEEPLGTITITLDPTDGVVVQVCGDLTDNDARYHNAYKFIRSFRRFAKSRLLNFDIQNISKSNLDKRDYAFQAKSKETNIMENKLFGTAKISYQNLGEARLVIKHNKPVNSTVAGGRTMNIECIYVENSDGERFKYPYKHLHGARAMAEHVSHGGKPYDSIGGYIVGLSEELGHLRKFKGYVTRQNQLSEAFGSITPKVVKRIDEVKKELLNLQRSSFYEQFVSTYATSDRQSIPEAVMTNWIDRLTIKTFNEDLRDALPYLYNIVEESDLPVVELDAAGLITDSYSQVTSDATRKFDIGSMYETYMDSIELNEDKDEIFSPNKDAQHSAIKKLNDILAKELRGGPKGINAIQSLAGLIDDPRFIEDLKHIDPDLDVRSLIQEYILEIDPEVAMQLNFGEGEIGGSDASDIPPLPPTTIAPSPAPMPPMGAPGEMSMGELPPEELPPAPMAESVSKTAKMKAKFIKAKSKGAKLDTPIGEGMTIGDAIREAGLDACECGYCDDDDTDQDDGDRENLDVDGSVSGTDQILQSISGFWNREKKNFTLGGTRVKTKIIKSFKEGEYSNASKSDLMKVLKLIDRMDPSFGEHEHDHAHAPSDGREEHITMMIKELQPMNESIDLTRIKKNAGIL